MSASTANFICNTTFKRGLYASILHPTVRDLRIRIAVPYVYDYKLKYKQRLDENGQNQVETLEDFYNKQIAGRNRSISSVNNGNFDEDDDFCAPEALKSPQKSFDFILAQKKNLKHDNDDYLREAIKTGLIELNGQACDPSTILKDGDILRRIWHRHESPVVDVSHKEMIIQETNDLVVINKPSTIPIHPGGAFRLNSLKYILFNERPDLGELSPVHRLDRLTSGLILMARNGESARKMGRFVQNQHGKSMRKVYLARVKGKFPQFQNELKDLRGISKTQMDENERCWGVCDIPITKLHPRKPILEQNDPTVNSLAWKECMSRFCYLGYNNATRTSLVACEPITGRTHQLRIHLFALGFPIANDEMYGGDPEQPDSLFTSQSELDAYRDDYYRAISQVKDSTLDSTARNPCMLDEHLVQKAECLCSDCRERRVENLNRKGIWLHAYGVRLLSGGQAGLVEGEFSTPPPSWSGEFDMDVGNLIPSSFS